MAGRFLYARIVSVHFRSLTPAKSTTYWLLSTRVDVPGKKGRYIPQISSFACMRHSKSREILSSFTECCATELHCYLTACIRFRHPDPTVNVPWKIQKTANSRSIEFYVKILRYSPLSLNCCSWTQVKRKYLVSSYPSRRYHDSVRCSFGKRRNFESENNFAFPDRSQNSV